MANFYPWIDAANDNVMSVSDFANDAQRKSGFQAGQAASSTRVNSALRQANLFVAALAELVIASNTTLNLTSSVDAVKTALAGAHPFNLRLWNSGTSLSGLNSNNTFSAANLESVAFGSNNSISTFSSITVGLNNVLTAGPGKVDMGAYGFGIGLNVMSYSVPKLVTGQYNEPCGDCARETGAGTATTRKTIEKLDKDGNLYVKSLHLSDLIDENENGDDGILDKETLKNLVTLANNLAADWTQENLNTAVLPEAGTYHVRGYYAGVYPVYFDFGLLYYDSEHGTTLPTKGAKGQFEDPEIATSHLISGFILSNGRIELMVDEQILTDSMSGYSGTKIWYKRIW